MPLLDSKFLLALPLFAAFCPGALADTAMFAPDRVGNWYLGGGVGGFREADNPALGDADGEFGTAFSGGYRLGPNVALEIDGLLTHQEFDTPAYAGGGWRSDLFTNGVAGVAKLIVPLGRVELYVGGGIGLYTSRVEIDGTLLEDEADDTGFGYQLLTGAEILLSRRLSVGFEYRRFELEADFGGAVPGGKVDTGGNLMLATVRGYF
jgi:opacity protein-like surface antigen